MADKNPNSKEVLEKEIIRLRKVNEALMDRVERGVGSNSPFTLFEKNVHLSTIVKERTLELEKLTTELENEKNKLSGIIHALPGAIFFFTNDYIVDRSFTNILEHQFYVQAGITLEKAIGRDFFELLKEQLSLLNETSVVVFFDYLKISAGEERYYHCSVSCRSPEQYVLYVQDNTAKYLQEKLIKEQDIKIMQSLRLASLGEMAAGVAHEINNPLAIINISASMIKKHLSRNGISLPAIDNLVLKMENTIARVSKIISVMRSISREPIEVKREDVLLTDIIYDVIALCGEKFKNNYVDLRLNIPDKAVYLYCDRLQISQVLLNLLNNAYDATDTNEERWIEVEYDENSQFDILTVTNSGPRISNEIISKIFNPFFTTKDVGKGTGLGLSISKSILDRHGGSIDVHPDSLYTCFVLKLPKNL